MIDRTRYVECMVRGYVACALWATIDTPDPDTGLVGALDALYGPDDVAPAASTDVADLCDEFAADNWADLTTWEPWSSGPEQAGRDLFLTRNHLGAGFWDRYFGPDADRVAAGERLAVAASAYGPTDAHASDDGMVYDLA